MFSIFQVLVMLFGLGIGILTVAHKHVLLPLLFLAFNLCMMATASRAVPLSESVEGLTSLFVLICLACVIPDPGSRYHSRPLGFGD